MAAYNNDVVINGLIHFDLDDAELEKMLQFLYAIKAPLRMDCKQCGTTIIPQCRAYYEATRKEEFTVDCIGCGRSHRVRLYGTYGFILPTDDEFYKEQKSIQ